MADNVTIIINDKEYEVPAGSNLVDAAKFAADEDIPVFCYHPKLDPVGMCRMCLVELGMIMKDRETGEVMLDDNGNPQIRWFPKVQTACTQIVSNGMVVKTNTKQVDDARENVLEFILTSHPLDCPICDKGGECPLQNLTMEHGPGTSRMIYDDKIHLDKHVPLGELIFLDRERCIQCARCTRFQDELIGDDVLAFHERGRRLQIITVSDPPFDTYFSGNTTDICPVGALTTADFRFGARPWELTNVPSISPYCAAGSNINLSTRLDRDFGGRSIIKRVMPRQHEEVNEIWISDKDRFGHHFTRSENRLMQPTVDGKAVSWADAMAALKSALEGADGSVAALAGAMSTNEDLWELKKIVEAADGNKLGAWPPTHAGADIVAQVGVGKGTNLSDLTANDAVLIIASDLEEEVPIWRLRLKQAADRGAFVVVANARPTRMDDFASRTVRYDAGAAAEFMANIGDNAPEIAEQLRSAENLIILTGAEGLTLEGSKALNQAAANFLIDSDHVGKPNNGLLCAFPGANVMGQYYLGYTAEAAQDIMANPPKVLILAQTDPAADDPAAAAWLGKVETVIALSLFPQEAAINLPIQSFAERDGTFTSAERRVQRFYTAQGPMGEALPMWQILTRVGEAMGGARAKMSAAAVMLEITQNVAAFEGCRYKELSKVTQQFPLMGRDDVYYGGTVYDNTGGLGVQIATAADNGDKVKAGKVDLPKALKKKKSEVFVIPSTRLYNREAAFVESANLMHQRIPEAYVEINSADAGNMKIEDGDIVTIEAGGTTVQVQARVNGGAPEGAVVLPRHLTETPVPMTISVGTVSKVESKVKA